MEQIMRVNFETVKCTISRISYFLLANESVYST